MKSELEWVNFFIQKFEKTKEEDWCIRQQQDEKGRRCAFGHCIPKNVRYIGNISYIDSKVSKQTFNKALALVRLGSILSPSSVTIAEINNGENPNYQQPTPKARVLAALYDIKAKLEPEVKERIVYVSIDKEVLQELELCEN